MLKQIVKFFVILNANTRPAHLAAGMACGVLLALIPASNLLWITLFLLTLLLKVNSSVQMLFLLIFKLAAPLTYGFSHNLGYTILTIPSLRNFFIVMKNMVMIPFTRYDFTLVTGGLILGLVLWIPIFLLGLLLIKLYRNTLRDKIANHKLVKGFKKLPLVAKLAALYQKVSGSYYGLG